MKNLRMTARLAAMALLIGAPALPAAESEVARPLASESLAGKPLVTEAFINAPTAEIWRLFTTSAGYKATGVAQAEVDLRIGGSIRSHYDARAQLGDPETIVLEILAYEPERMLALRVKQAPASLPNRAALDGTWSVLYFNPAGENMTQMRIVGLGYDDTAESRALRKFFAEGNRATLDHIAKQYWPQCALCKSESPPAE